MNNIEIRALARAIVYEIVADLDEVDVAEYHASRYSDGITDDEIDKVLCLLDDLKVEFHQ